MSRTRRPSRRARHLAAAAIAGLVIGACGASGETTKTAVATGPVSAEGLVVEVHRSETCDCCVGYADYLTDLGVEVVDVVVDDLLAVKASVGIPAELHSCHTSFVDGYAVEGHVPIEVILDLLEQRPAVDAIALAGMPAGSPGMGGEKAGAWTIHAVTNGYKSFHTTH